jgi:hypothetical protein
MVLRSVSRYGFELDPVRTFVTIDQNGVGGGWEMGEYVYLFISDIELLWLRFRGLK